MQSDTAKAKQAVLAYMERQGQATTAELGEVIAQVLGDGFTEGKAAGAIRMCVEEAGSPIIRLGRGLYQYQPQTEAASSCAAQAQPEQAFAQKAAIDRVMAEALQLAKAHIREQLDLYALDAQAFAYASRIIDQFNRAVESD